MKDPWLYGSRCTSYEISLLNPDRKLHKIAIDRHNELFKLPLTLAVKSKLTDEIFTDGNAHGDIRLKHNLNNREFIRGFLYNNEFITAEEARLVVKEQTGYTTSEETLMSGEEWIPKLECTDDAVYFGSRLHEYGYNSARIRLDLFQSKNINHNHVRLLKIMIDEYKKTRSGNRRSN